MRMRDINEVAALLTQGAIGAPQRLLRAQGGRVPIMRGALSAVARGTFGRSARFSSAGHVVALARVLVTVRFQDRLQLRLHDVTAEFRVPCHLLVDGTGLFRRFPL